MKINNSRYLTLLCVGLLTIGSSSLVHHFFDNSNLVSDFVKGVGASLVLWGFFQLVKNTKLKSQS